MMASVRPKHDEQGDDEKLGWSDTVATVDLCGDSSSEDEAVTMNPLLSAGQQQRLARRQRQRFNRPGTNATTLANVARMPIDTSHSKQAYDTDHHPPVILLDDEDNSSPGYGMHSRKRRRIDSNGDAVEVVSLRRPPNALAAAAAALESHDDVVQLVSVKTTPMNRILEVFPEVETTYAQSLLSQHGMKPEDNGRPVVAPQEESIVQKVLSLLAENSYPKSTQTTQSSMSFAGVRGVAAAHDGVILQRNDGVLKTYKYDYMSSSSFTPTPEYIHQCHTLLESDFPFLTKVGVKKHLAAAQHHYAICHDVICNAVMGKQQRRDGTKTKSTPTGQTTREAAGTHGGDNDQQQQEEQQYSSLNRALSGHPLNRQQRDALMINGVSMVLRRPRSGCKAAPSVQVTDPTLQEEVQYVKKKLTEWRSAVETRMERRKARIASEKAGSTMECQCCFASVALDEMISCSREGHLFCVDCLRRFAEAQVFGAGNLGIDKQTGGPALELLCMYSDGCSSGFEPDHLRKAFDDNLLQKYNELQFQAAVEKAGVEDMCTCPKCGFKAVLPHTEMIFHCPVQGCEHESCRMCQEPPHIPLRCSEVEKKHETKGRLKVEEAISNAKIRTCPKPNCRKKFVKESGCNKMTCACGTHVCYICRAEITKSVGYKHFCQKPHCTHKDCNLCPLYTKNEEDDQRAMREAGLQAAEQVREESLIAEAAATSLQTGVASRTEAAEAPHEVRIDVDNLLQDPGNPQVARKGNGRVQLRQRQPVRRARR